MVFFARQPSAFERIDALSQFYAGLGARRWYGDHVCLAAQPDSGHGSPDPLVEDGVAEAAEVTNAWGAEVVSALRGVTSEAAIRRAIDRVELQLDVTRFAELLAEKMERALMLGALDSERERLREIALETNKLSASVLFDTQTRSFARAPRESAIKLWEQRQVLPPEEFAALSDELKGKAFTYAELARTDLISSVHAELGRQLKTGELELKRFETFVEERLKKAGWTGPAPSHVETVFRTNVASALTSGRYADQTQPAVLKALPFWEIRGVTDARQRPTHKAAHGTILPADHPFWRVAYPPFGFNCRCQVIARTRSWVDRNNARIGPVPRNLPDPGFTSGRRGIVTVPADVKRITEERKAAQSTEQPRPEPELQRPTNALPQLPDIAPPAPSPIRPRARRRRAPLADPVALPTPAELPTVAAPDTAERVARRAGEAATPPIVPTGAGLPRPAPRWVPQPDGSQRGEGFAVDALVRKVGKRWEVVIDGQATKLPAKATFDHAEVAIREAVERRAALAADMEARAAREAQDAALKAAEVAAPKVPRAKTTKAWTSAMSPDTKNAFDSWSSGWSGNIASVQQGGAAAADMAADVAAKAGELLRHMEDAVELAPKHAGRIYRGMHVLPHEFEQIVSAEVFETRSFSSFSRSARIAEEFATDLRADRARGMHVVLSVEVKHARAHAIDSLSNAKREMEVLVSKGERFRVTGTEKKGSVTTIFMEELVP